MRKVYLRLESIQRDFLGGVGGLGSSSEEDSLNQVEDCVHLQRERWFVN